MCEKEKRIFKRDYKLLGLIIRFSFSQNMINNVNQHNLPAFNKIPQSPFLLIRTIRPNLVLL